MFKASAPGSLMVLGEYAVLNGKYSLVAAVNHRITVQLIPRLDTKIKITSQLGIHETDITDIGIIAPFQFVLCVLKKYRKELLTGCDLIIESEFSDQIGFASSSAVTVATIAVLHQWLKKEVTSDQLILAGREVVQAVQGGVGSGADVAACVLGGVVAYRANPFSAEKLPFLFPLTVIYSGKKTKTADAIKIVMNNFVNDPEVLQQILEHIEACAIMGIKAMRENNKVMLGNAMNAQQGLMESLGVNTPQIDEIITALNDDKQNILGAKISGSGLGDCVIGLGHSSVFSTAQIKAEITSQGLLCE